MCLGSNFGYNRNIFIIPANSKKSQLILSYFTLFDLIIFACGVGFSLILLLTFKNPPFYGMVLMILPALISAFLILPLPPHYHNVMTFMGNIYRYFTGRKKYYWRGWCVSSGDNRKK